MVYIHSWQSFQEQAEALYAEAPNKTRYCVKWRDGKLVLKITDDTRCIKFKTHSSIFLNRFEALNLGLMQKMQNWKPPPPPAVSAPASTRAQSPQQGLHAEDAQTGSRAVSPAPGTLPGAGGGPAGGGVKKKKGKKKK